jgi:hypothetical protein
MPRKQINDYSFYKIVCLDDSVDLCYVGSTANFNARKRNHKNACNNENWLFKLYITMRENGGWDNFKMIEIGKREQLTKREAEQIEEDYRQELKANMNGKRCFVSPEQVKEEKKIYDKERKQANKEHIAEVWKNYYVEHKEKLSKDNKEYYEVNKEKILEKRKNSYDKEKRRQRYLAEKEAKIKNKNIK